MISLKRGRDIRRWKWPFFFALQTEQFGETSENCRNWILWCHNWWASRSEQRANTTNMGVFIVAVVQNLWNKPCYPLEGQPNFTNKILQFDVFLKFFWLFLTVHLISVKNIRVWKICKRIVNNYILSVIFTSTFFCKKRFDGVIFGLCWIFFFRLRLYRRIQLFHWKDILRLLSLIQ